MFLVNRKTRLGCPEMPTKMDKKCHLPSRNQFFFYVDFFCCCCWVFIILRILVTFSPMISTLAGLYEPLVDISTSNQKRITRSVLFLVLSTIAFYIQDNLNYVEAITGAFASIVSVFVLPAVSFFLQYLSFFF